MEVLICYLLMLDRDRGASTGHGSSWYFTSHGETHRNLHEWRPGKAAVLRAGHTHLGEDAKIIVSASCETKNLKKHAMISSHWETPLSLRWKILNTCLKDQRSIRLFWVPSLHMHTHSSYPRVRWQIYKCLNCRACLHLLHGRLSSSFLKMQHE